MQKLLFLLLTLTVISVANHASALNIAFVDMQRIMSESKAGKNAKSQLDAKQKAYQADASKKQTAMQEERKALAGQQALLSGEAFNKKLTEFNKKAIEIQRSEQEKRLEYRKGYDKSIVTIQKTVLKIINDMASGKQYDMVLTKGQALYSNPSFDITDAVLTKLDEQLPTISLNFKQ